MKILYLYNQDDWAIHNVGKLWFDDVQDTQITMLNYHQIKGKDSTLKEYDFVWYGYIYMYKRFPWEPSKSIVTIHDPMELYPEIPEWKSHQILKEQLELLKNFRYIVTISREVHELAKRSGIETSLINTNSLLPVRDKRSIVTTKASSISVLHEYPRKNAKMLRRIQKHYHNSSSLEIRLRIDEPTVSAKEYTQILDDYEIYLCTSYQEGGPLPAMDSMKRGGVVLTTPVGQIQDIIEDSVSGYICSSYGDFIEKLDLLSSGLSLLHNMRLASIDAITSKRSKMLIDLQVNDFFTNIQ